MQIEKQCIFLKALQKNLLKSFTETSHKNTMEQQPQLKDWKKICNIWSTHTHKTSNKRIFRLLKKQVLKTQII